MIVRADQQIPRAASRKTTTSITFWGTRGSIPCGGSDYIRYGGNTACVELRCDEKLLIFDGGSGIRNLGNVLIESLPEKIDIFLTHCHFDHVCGLPFFAPFYMPSARICLWGGGFATGLTTKSMLAALMKSPFSPVTPSIFQAQVEYCDFCTGDVLYPGEGIKIKTVGLHHPQGATCYCVFHAGRKICYLTDTAIGPNGIDSNMIDAANGADILIIDSMFTDEEFDERTGWGHMSWRQAVALADAAEAHTLVLFHHHPKHNDIVMDEIAREAGRLRANVIVARENMTLKI